MIAALKQKVKEFKVDVIDRVDWPKPDKVRQSTYAVVIVSAFVAVYFFLCDEGISRALALFMPKH